MKRTIRLLTVGVALGIGSLGLAGCDRIETALGNGACGGETAKSVSFISVERKDRLAVESFGGDCSSAHVLIYVESPDGLIEPLHLGLLGDYAPDVPTKETLAATLDGILEMVREGDDFSFESYEEIILAGQQPGGAPWRGTPLVKAEYDRIVGASPRKIFIPTDLSRGKLVVWDEAVIARPVMLVYYGD